LFLLRQGIPHQFSIAINQEQTKKSEAETEYEEVRGISARSQ
jgi:hypothetical protein